MRFSARFAAAMAGVFVLSGSFALVQGDEPPKACPETKVCPETLACQEAKACQCPQVGVPILSNIPYVSRLFKSVGVVHEPGCEAGACAKTPCADQLERIGVDFGFCQTCPDGVVRFGPIELAICSEDENCCCRDKACPAACAGCACPSAGKMVGWQAAVSDKPNACEATICEATACAAKCDEAKCCAGECKCAAATAGRDELWKHLVEVSAEKAAAEAALEAREEQSELLDALVEMATKSAALEAKLEAQAEHQKLMEQMVELASENAQLKARTELAEAKSEMLRETIPVVVEKELLARRVASLEERLAARESERSQENIRTAKKAERKSAE